MESKIPNEWNKFILKDVTFVNLMMRRIYNVLIVANHTMPSCWKTTVG